MALKNIFMEQDLFLLIPAVKIFTMLSFNSSFYLGKEGKKEEKTFILQRILWNVLINC